MRQHWTLLTIFIENLKYGNQKFQSQKCDGWNACVFVTLKMTWKEAVESVESTRQLVMTSQFRNQTLVQRVIFCMILQILDISISTKFRIFHTWVATWKNYDTMIQIILSEKLMTNVCRIIVENEKKSLRVSRQLIQDLCIIRPKMELNWNCCQRVWQEILEKNSISELNIHEWELDDIAQWISMTRHPFQVRGS